MQELKWAYEGMLARMERTIKRLWILALVLVCLLVATNGAWLWYESQFEETTEQTITQEVDTGEGAAYVSATGDVINGESPADSKDN